MTSRRNTPAPSRPSRSQKSAAPVGVTGEVSSADVNALKSALRGRFASVTSLGDCLRSRSTLSCSDRVFLVEQALLLLQNHYVHLSMKRVLHAADPIARLNLLLRRVQAGNSEGDLNEDEFNREMLDIFFSLHD